MPISVASIAAWVALLISLWDYTDQLPETLANYWPFIFVILPILVYPGMMLNSRGEIKVRICTRSFILGLNIYFMIVVYSACKAVNTSTVIAPRSNVGKAQALSTAPAVLITHPHPHPQAQPQMAASPRPYPMATSPQPYPMAASPQLYPMVAQAQVYDPMRNRQ